MALDLCKAIGVTDESQIQECEYEYEIMNTDNNGTVSATKTASAGCVPAFNNCNVTTMNVTINNFQKVASDNN